MKHYLTKTNAATRIAKDYYGVSAETLGVATISISQMPISRTNATYYTVFDGPYAGWYHSYNDACEAAWYSNEIVGIHKNLANAKYALKVYKKKG